MWEAVAFITTMMVGRWGLVWDMALAGVTRVGTAIHGMAMVMVMVTAMGTAAIPTTIVQDITGMQVTITDTTVTAGIFMDMAGMLTVEGVPLSPERAAVLEEIQIAALLLLPEIELQEPPRPILNWLVIALAQAPPRETHPVATQGIRSLARAEGWRHPVARPQRGPRQETRPMCQPPLRELDHLAACVLRAPRPRE
jgi:hypothetical protein